MNVDGEGVPAGEPDSRRGEAGFLDAAGRADVDELTADLLERGVRAMSYHAGLSTDNRTISGTTLSDEYALAAKALGLSWSELTTATTRAAEAAFAPAETRRALARRVQDEWASHAK